MIVLVLISIALGVYWLWSRGQGKFDPPAAPGGWPILGHAALLIGNSCYLWKAVNDLAEKSYQLGGVVTVTVGPRTVYVVTDPDDAITVANASLQKDCFYDFAKPWLGEGLVTGNLSVWRFHRKLFQPAFCQSVLDSYVEVFNGQSRKLVKDLEVEVGKGQFDHWSYMRHNALETICLTALGVDFTDQNLNSQYVETIEVIFRTLVIRFQKFWLHSSFIFNFSGVKKKQDECLKILHNVADKVIQKRKSEMRNKSTEYDINGNEKVPDRSIKFKPFLNQLLEMSMDNGGFTDKEIRENVDTMIVGAHDTTANVLMFTLILLGSHPEIQARVIDELKEVFEGSDRDVEKADLPKLMYLEAVLKESMRIYSIVPVIARKLDRNIKLKNYTLSSGRTCFIFLCGIHRHPVWGPDADEFKPDRWFDANRLPDNPNAFAGFMMGRRMCIGKTYAYMSMKISLVHLLRRYSIKADHTQLELKLSVMLKPASGHNISIEERNNYKLPLFKDRKRSVGQNMGINI